MHFQTTHAIGLLSVLAQCQAAAVSSKSTGTSTSSTKAATTSSCATPQTAPVSSTSTCTGQTYINRGLVGYGSLPANAVDNYGDTIGGIGSGIAPLVESFLYLPDGSISGELFAIPDRGWNTQGTINYRNRIHTFGLKFKPKFDKCNTGANAQLTYQTTELLSGSQGLQSLTTGLDAVSVIPAANQFPDLPAAPLNGVNVSALDTESIVRISDGSFWLADEYGPYIYHYSVLGQMIGAIRPPNAFIPLRNGTENFASDNPPIGQAAVNPAEPTVGRENNHGFEGLAISPDEKYLTALLQAALLQDGGDKGTTENATRILTYDISKTPYTLVSEYVVGLPETINPVKGAKKARVDDASELHYLSTNKFLILSRDSGNGNGAASDTASVYRQIDIIDTTSAVNYASSASANAFGGTVAPGGAPAVGPVTYCSFLNFNNNTDLARFGLHNGPPGGVTELDEKWESIAVIPVPALAPFAGKDEYYLISMSDNDFITTDGKYGCASGACTSYSDPTAVTYGDNPTQFLIWQVNLPGYQYNL